VGLTSGVSLSICRDAKRWPDVSRQVQGREWMNYKRRVWVKFWGSFVSYSESACMPTAETGSDLLGHALGKVWLMADGSGYDA
jgi:hypothetical protein